MSKSTKKPAVTAPEVRAWAEEQGLIPAGQRGRLGTDVATAWNKANPRRKYVLTYSRKAEPVIKHTVKVKGKPPVTRTLPQSKVRALAVEAGFGARGKFSPAALDAAFTLAAQ